MDQNEASEGRGHFCVLGDEEHHRRNKPPADLLKAFEVALGGKYGSDKVSRQRRSVTIDFGVKPDADEGILAIEVDWKDGFSKSFEECHSKLTGLKQLDCGLAVDGHSFDIFAETNAFAYCKTENALVFFLFRLLNQLQSLGTVPAIDWNAYASQLSR